MMKAAKLSQRVWQDPIYFIAFGFGTGLMPVAPGTFGTLAALPLFLLLTGLTPAIYLLVVAALFVIGVWVSDIVSKDLGIEDYKGIVFDEVVGYLATMFMAPAGLVWMLIGFVLFRIFDIWKPQPITYIEQHIGGGMGVMLDDLVAAIPAWIILQVLAWNFAG